MGQVTGIRSAAFGVRAFIVGIGIGGDGSALAIDARAAFGGGAGHTRSGTRIATTNAVDTIAGHALRCGTTRRAIVMNAGSGTIAIPGGAFTIRIFRGGNGTTCAIAALELFRG